MKKKDLAKQISETLIGYYPDAKCSLDFTKPYELLIAGRLSAQCTDKRVNIVTKDLFQKYPTLEAFANANVDDVAEIIKPCGLFKTKAKSIVEMSIQLVGNFGGELPQTIDELTTLSGIGRKTANLILGDIYGKPAIVTDTHFIRITNRLGLTKNSEPKKVEEDLRKILPLDTSARFCHCIVHHGREVCKARGALCEICCLNQLCKNAKKAL